MKVVQPKYQDGLLVTNETYKKGVRGDGSLVFGADQDHGNNPTNGFSSSSLDDIRIYNRVLSSNEIQSLYAAEAPPELYETHTYKLVSGTGDTDNSSFAIDSASGVVTTSETFDFESRSEYSIRVESKDAGGNKFTKAISITVADRQDAPTAITTDPESERFVKDYQQARW